MTIQGKTRHSVTQVKFSFSYAWGKTRITWVIKHPQSPERGRAPGGRFRFTLLQDWSSVPAWPFTTCRNLTCSQDTQRTSFHGEMYGQHCYTTVRQCLWTKTLNLTPVRLAVFQQLIYLPSSLSTLDLPPFGPCLTLTLSHLSINHTYKVQWTIRRNFKESVLVKVKLVKLSSEGCAQLTHKENCQLKSHYLFHTAIKNS